MFRLVCLGEMGDLVGKSCIDRGSLVDGDVDDGDGDDDDDDGAVRGSCGESLRVSSGPRGCKSRCCRLAPSPSSAGMTPLSWRP